MSHLLDDAVAREQSQGRPPKPPVEEQEGRLERVRASLDAHELDGLLVWGSASANCDPIRFLSGYVHVFPGASSLLLVPRVDGETVAHNPSPKDQRGVIDDSHISVRNVGLIGQVKLNAQRELQPIEGRQVLIH